MTPATSKVANAVATEIASPAPVYQDIKTRRDPWPRLLEHKGKTPVLRLASFGGGIDLLPFNAITSDYDYDLYRSALTLALSFDHWREETRLDATGQARRVAVLENPSGAAEHVAFEADMFDAEATDRAPRYRLIDRKTRTPIDVSAQVTALEPRAHGRTHPSLVRLTFSRRSEYLLTEPLYGLKPGTALALWYGSLL
ncbi:hypothetical protein [Pannonibacter sp. SL95]|uniref:hypothetical protein n=1 Tax=Pannonibacter sp. SL95 TaxID=2995153 RepID=UPI002272547D|nr:hypothetical protein [Pannonibacter sp. SL95]MCY1707298.1 hypothetical protein [Pannonibacter sp. SL95]MCY1709023.1 hypothetical protein [Pannonibacter sp. SL95]